MKGNNDEQHATREVMEMEVNGTQKRGRSRIRWKDCIGDDMRKDCRMKWPTTEVLGEGSLETATPSRNKAGKKKQGMSKVKVEGKND